MLGSGGWHSAKSEGQCEIVEPAGNEGGETSTAILGAAVHTWRPDADIRPPKNKLYEFCFTG